METSHKVGWFVSLSNGETKYEFKNEYVEIKGEASPWSRLLLYLAENDLEITSLGLYTEKGQRFNLPSLGKNPKFRAFDLAEKPKEYKAYRKLGFDTGNGEMIEGTDDLFTIAEAVYQDYSLQIWVSERNTNNCWVLKV
jgi:hypothetical protein